LRLLHGELAEANQRLTIVDRSKSEFLNLISHELRTPLNGLFGVGELMLDQMTSTEENSELQELFENSRRRILSIVDDALLLTQIDVSGERFRSGPVSLNAVLNRAIAGAIAFAEPRHVALSPSPPGLGLVVGDEDLLARAFQALLETAVKFSERGGRVRLSRDEGPDSRGVIIETRGRTIPGPALGKFFELFSIGGAITPGGDLGLAAPVAHRILALFGASVRVANGESGIRLTVSLKDAPSQLSGRAASPVNSEVATLVNSMER
jgi:signal transduction histidine kinase